ncbi:MAG: hypothetical protein M3354_03480 [Chloroflexota bacterium]|nr:hypothetical protein [Chloroflexota bacterium]
MPQLGDVEIAGVGYTLAAYSRKHDSTYRRLSGRLSLRDFAGGLLAPYQSPDASGQSPGSGWDGLSVGPVYDGQGLEPFPYRTTFTDAAGAFPSTTTRAVGVVHGSRMYLAAGTRLYRSGLLTAANWSALSLVATFPQTITDITPFKDDLMILVGGATMKRYNVAANTITDPWVSGEQGLVGQGYKGQLVFCPGLPQEQYVLRLSSLNANGVINFWVRHIDAPAVKMGMFGGKVAVATKQSLYLFDGDWLVNDWTATVEPIFSHGIWTAADDFQWLLSFHGRLYTWLAGRVVVYDPGAEGEQWQESGPTGQATYGAAIAGGFLCVALLSPAGVSELWATDGRGWFLLDRRTDVTLIWPCTTGGVGDVDLLVFKAGVGEYELYRLVPHAGALRTYAPSGEWVTSLLDAGDPANIKSWTEVGALFAAPEVRGEISSVDPVNIFLDYSIDAGTTWTQAATAAPATPSTRATLLSVALAGVSSRHLQLRVRWISVLDWAPVLSELWAEWVVDDTAAPRRKWELKVTARDKQIRRDGSLDPNTGQQQIDTLWAAWAAGSTVTFRDIDYDTTAITRTARIVGIAEEVAKPSDAGKWGQGTIVLTLIEV